MITNTIHPTYSIILPCSKQEITFRPFLRKEEKILLMALESDNEEDYLKAMKQILKNCCNDNSLDVEKLPIIDVEYLFLQLRAKSVGEIITEFYKCENMVNDKPCGNRMELKIDISKIEPTDGGESKIMLAENIGLQMRHPNFVTVKKNVKNQTEYMDELIASCVEMIFDKENIVYADKCKPEDIIEFLDSLTSEQYNKIVMFFEDLPILQYETNLVCNKCGFNHKIKKEGYEDFFV